MKPVACLLAVLSIGLFLPAAAQSRRPQVDLRCESVGQGPQLECAVKVRTADGQPVPGARVRLGASMPSMPMAHAVRPVQALPSAQPGDYRGRLMLEMSGAWAVEVDISGPVRERTVEVVMAQECEGRGRCAAPPTRVCGPDMKP